MKKRVLSILTALALTLGLCTPLGGLMPEAKAAEIASGTCGAGLTWTLDSEGTLTISGEGEMYNFGIEGTRPADFSPEDIGWNDYRDEIRSIVIEEGVSVTCLFAFEYCTNLTSVSLPDSLVVLDGFRFCTSLTSIVIPDGVKCIENTAFKGSGLESVYLPDSVTEIEPSAFEDCTSLKTVRMPSSVEEMGWSTFAGCTNLTSVKVPEGVTELNQTFSGCSSLKSVNVPLSVTEMFDAFYISGIEEIYYAGTREQWDAIRKRGLVISDEIVIHYNSQSPDQPEEKPENTNIPTPILERAEYASGAVTVEWTTPLNTSDTAYTVDGFYVLRKTGSGSYTRIATVQGDLFGTYRDTSVTEGQTYTYTVQAYYQDQTGGYVAEGIQVTCVEPVDGVSVVGRILEDGEYPITFRTDTQDHDITYDFYYSEDFFRRPATEYDHELAQMSLGLIVSGFSTRASDAQYTTDGDVGREDNIRAAYETLGFDHAEFYNYDVGLDCTDNKVAFSFARKTISRDGALYTVIPVILRGGGYGAEWASNFYVNDDSAHTGFRNAAEAVYDALEDYLQREDDLSELGTVKLWIGGYSRAAATANLLAALVCNDLDGIIENNVYAYTFAAPHAVTGMEEGGVSWDYNNNYNAWLIPKSSFDETCIHNIINSGDIVPRIPLNDWGYHRNGNDMFLPATRMEEEAEALNDIYEDITGTSIDFAQLATSATIQNLENALADICGSVSYYERHYQDALMDIMQYMYMSNTADFIDSDAYVAQKIASLDNIDLSELQILPYVQAAKALGSDSEYAPLVAIGLCHGLSNDAIGLLFQAFIGPVYGIFPFGVTNADFSSVMAGHYPEVYMALMEYYGEDGYTMKPQTHGSDWGDEVNKIFNDVFSNSFYANPVIWAVSNGVTTGTSDTTFSPDRTCTRAEVVTFLWRANGSPEPLQDANPFTDVDPDDYYYTAALWAAQAEVAAGDGSGRFLPDAACTRAQVVTFLWRTQPIRFTTNIDGLEPFADVDPDDYFYSAVVWAVSNDVTTGTGGNAFSPYLACTRAQVVTFLYRDFA